MTTSGRPATSEVICRADVICTVSSYHIFLIGGYQFSVFLIDSSNRDTLSAVYSSLIAGQTLLKCQYLLFFSTASFSERLHAIHLGTLLLYLMHREGWYKLYLYFIILYPCSSHGDGLIYQPPWLSLGSSRNVPSGCSYWGLLHSAISTCSDEPCSLEAENLEWIEPLKVCQGSWLFSSGLH